MRTLRLHGLLSTLAAATLAAAAVSTMAQTAGGKADTDKLMTRAELRACFKEQDTIKTERVNIERDRVALDADYSPLKLERDAMERELAAIEALKAESTKVDQTNAEAVAAYNQKMTDAVNNYNQKRGAVDSKTEAWNGRNAAAKEREKAFTETQDKWKASCSNRRYREDDEKAVRAGK